jgi:hypothetical protein
VAGAVLTVADAARLAGLGPSFGGRQVLGGVVDAQEHLGLRDGARFPRRTGSPGIVGEPERGLLDHLRNRRGDGERRVGARAAPGDAKARQDG